MESPTTLSAEELAAQLKQHLRSEVERLGGPQPARKPGHRVPFLWPPPNVTHEYHVLESDWSGSAEIEAYGERFPVKLAKTAYGVFGKIERLWNEAKGDSVEEVLQQLRRGAQPYFDRQLLIGSTIGLEGRYTGRIAALTPLELVKLLYCEDRDIGHDAAVEIEAHASNHLFGYALIEVIMDRDHPNRRIAQWFALDLFEDLPSYLESESDQDAAISSIRDLMIEAQDDFARTVYKAGVVLGGHVCTVPAMNALFEALGRADRIGRRSAIHGLFHLAEWLPEQKDVIVSTLRGAAQTEADAHLKEFAEHIAEDIERGEEEHATEPIFADEP